MTTRLRIVYHRNAQVTQFSGQARQTPLRQALATAELCLIDPLPAELAERPMDEVLPEWVTAAGLAEGTVLHRPDGGTEQHRELPDTAVARPAAPPGRPESVSEGLATRIAYRPEVHDAASFLRAGLSVLVTCDKIVVPHLAEYMVETSGQEPRVLAVPAAEQDQDQPPIDMRQVGGLSLRQRLLARLREMLQDLTSGQVLVLSQLDLLGGGSDAALSNESRDLIDVLYAAESAVLLGFSDPSLTLPEVLAARFAVRMAIEGSPRTVIHPQDGSSQPIERVLLTQAEADRFGGIDDVDFYKYVAGLNPVRLRQAVMYSYQETEGRDRVSVADLQDNIRKFKAQASTNFEIPVVGFDDIGGYADVKEQINRALDIMSTARQLPDEHAAVRGELVPRGFIFHGEPGTGKTLFAKAIANRMEATIQVVSGPEVTNKYVGESERRIRELFAEARRNAPAVIVFDEFDTIAASRSSSDDGGSRAGNAMVGQILTEMDGFRPDVQMLVIGTTNRLEIIDRALLRPSRFQSFHIGLPDQDARRGIIEVHAKRFDIDARGLLDPLVAATEGWNGDEIRALFRDAFVGRWRFGLDPDAERLGQLVGQYQRARREQRRSKAGR